MGKYAARHRWQSNGPDRETCSSPALDYCTDRTSDAPRLDMRNASGQPNHYAGTVGLFTIKATGVNLKMCEQSWTFDKEEDEASQLREASGLAAVVTAKSNMALRVAAENCDTFFLREHGYTRQFDRSDEGNYLAYLWGEPAEGRV